MGGFAGDFLRFFAGYFREIIPPLAFGFLASGIIHEFIPQNWVGNYLGKRGIKPLLYATLLGTVAPVCCWGSLPIAVSFHKKGASMGVIFAFLVATPATSVSALLVAWRFLGAAFTAYIFCAVIVMGLVMGAIGNFFRVTPRVVNKHVHTGDGGDCPGCLAAGRKPALSRRIISVLRYAFITMPREIGLEIVIGIALAALVSAAGPVGYWIRSYLTEGLGYVFALVSALVVYVCSTMTVPLVHAFIREGMNAGAAMTFIILGPIASTGTIFVLRKEFGLRRLAVFLGTVSALSLLAGYIFSLV
ncbi:MAG: permease [Candidatus Omnitrophica bacterium]|nr:permease [Candidatus Omnitrophota bacterium]